MSSDVSHRSRQVAGTPTGGQFRTEARTEPQISLAPTSPSPSPMPVAERASAALALRMADLGPVLCGVSDASRVRGARPIDVDRIAGEVADEVVAGGWGPGYWRGPAPTRDQIASLIAKNIRDYDMVELDPSDMPPNIFLADLADGGTYREVGQLLPYYWGRHPEHPRMAQFRSQVAGALDIPPGTEPGEVRRRLKSLRTLARRGDLQGAPGTTELSAATRRLGEDSALPQSVVRVREAAAAAGLIESAPAPSTTRSPADSKNQAR